jgi:two-component system, sensor histidine kinase and response regulator
MNEKPKILIVDDKPENLLALRTVLKGLEVDLIEAKSGNEALKATLYNDFALALLDIQMPEMDGYELASILREEEKTANMPFIFISAVYTDNLNVFKGYEKGAFSFITKPFQPEILINKVKYFIDKHQQQITLHKLYEELKKANTELELSNLKLDERVKERTKELEKTNKRLEYMLDVLSAKNHELEQFAYIASHDLQEPLRTVSSFAQLLEKGYKNKLDERGDLFLKNILQSSERMRTLISGLLEYSRIGSEKNKSETDCNELLKELLNDLSLIIEENNAKVAVHPLPTLPVYKNELKQLFQNLITNALKFQQKNNTPQIEIGAEEQLNYWKFYVKDNGIGIEPEYHQKVFIIFQRLHSRTEFEGSGIGLAHCKKIAELHEGKIWVESDLNKGSTFYFTITKEHKL